MNLGIIAEGRKKTDPVRGTSVVLRLQPHRRLQAYYPEHIEVTGAGIWAANRRYFPTPEGGWLAEDGNHVIMYRDDVNLWTISSYMGGGPWYHAPLTEDIQDATGWIVEAGIGVNPLPTVTHHPSGTVPVTIEALRLSGSDSEDDNGLYFKEIGGRNWTKPADDDRGIQRRSFYPNANNVANFIYFFQIHGIAANEYAALTAESTDLYSLTSKADDIFDVPLWLDIRYNKLSPMKLEKVILPVFAPQGTINLDGNPAKVGDIVGTWQWPGSLPSEQANPYLAPALRLVNGVPVIDTVEGKKGVVQLNLADFDEYLISVLVKTPSTFVNRGYSLIGNANWANKTGVSVTIGRTRAGSVFAGYGTELGTYTEASIQTEDDWSEHEWQIVTGHVTGEFVRAYQNGHMREVTLAHPIDYGGVETINIGQDDLAGTSNKIGGYFVYTNPDDRGKIEAHLRTLIPPTDKKDLLSEAKGKIELDLRSTEGIVERIGVDLISVQGAGTSAVNGLYFNYYPGICLNIDDPSIYMERDEEDGPWHIKTENGTKYLYSQITPGSHPWVGGGWEPTPDSEDAGALNAPWVYFVGSNTLPKYRRALRVTGAANPDVNGIYDTFDPDHVLGPTWLKSDGSAWVVWGNSSTGPWYYATANSISCYMSPRDWNNGVPVPADTLLNGNVAPFPSAELIQIPVYKSGRMWPVEAGSTQQPANAEEGDPIMWWKGRNTALTHQGNPLYTPTQRSTNGTPRLDFSGGKHLNVEATGILDGKEILISALVDPTADPTTNVGIAGAGTYEHSGAFIGMLSGPDWRPPVAIVRTQAQDKGAATAYQLPLYKKTPTVITGHVDDEGGIRIWVDGVLRGAHAGVGPYVGRADFRIGDVGQGGWHGSSKGIYGVTVSRDPEDRVLVEKNLKRITPAFVDGREDPLRAIEHDIIGRFQSTEMEMEYEPEHILVTGAGDERANGRYFQSNFSAEDPQWSKRDGQWYFTTYAGVTSWTLTSNFIGGPGGSYTGLGDPEEFDFPWQDTFQVASTTGPAPTLRYIPGGVIPKMQDAIRVSGAGVTRLNGIYTWYWNYQNGHRVYYHRDGHFIYWDTAFQGGAWGICTPGYAHYIRKDTSDTIWDNETIWTADSDESSGTAVPLVELVQVPVMKPSHLWTADGKTTPATDLTTGETVPAWGWPHLPVALQPSAWPRPAIRTIDQIPMVTFAGDKTMLLPSDFMRKEESFCVSVLAEFGHNGGGFSRAVVGSAFSADGVTTEGWFMGQGEVGKVHLSAGGASVSAARNTTKLWNVATAVISPSEMSLFVDGGATSATAACDFTHLNSDIVLGGGFGHWNTFNGSIAAVVFYRDPKHRRLVEKHLDALAKFNDLRHVTPESHISGLPFPGEVLTSSHALQWYRDGTLLEGERNKTFTIPTNALTGHGFHQKFSNRVEVLVPVVRAAADFGVMKTDENMMRVEGGSYAPCNGDYYQLPGVTDNGKVKLMKDAVSGQEIMWITDLEPFGEAHAGTPGWILVNQGHAIPAFNAADTDWPPATGWQLNEEFGGHTVVPTFTVLPDDTPADTFDLVPLIQNRGTASAFKQETSGSQGFYLNTPGIFFPGTAGNHASVPSSTPLQWIEDLEIVVSIVGEGHIPTQWYQLVNKTGEFRLDWIPDGRIAYDIAGAGQVGSFGTLPDDFSGWLKFTFNYTTNIARLYTSPDGEVWTQKGSDNLYQYTPTLTPNGNPVHFGIDQRGITKRAIIKNAGVAVLDIDFTDPAVSENATTFVCSTGQTVSIARSGLVRANLVRTPEIITDGADDWYHTDPIGGTERFTRIFVGGITAAGVAYSNTNAYYHPYVGSSYLGLETNMIECSQNRPSDGMPDVTSNLTVRRSDVGREHKQLMIVQVCDGTHAGHILRVNGVNQPYHRDNFTNDPGEFESAAHQRTLSAYYGGGGKCALRFKEVLEFDRVLHTDVIKQIEGQLMKKYGPF